MHSALVHRPDGGPAWGGGPPPLVPPPPGRSPAPGPGPRDPDPRGTTPSPISVICETASPRATTDRETRACVVRDRPRTTHAIDMGTATDTATTDTAAATGTDIAMDTGTIPDVVPGDDRGPGMGYPDVACTVTGAIAAGGGIARRRPRDGRIAGGRTEAVAGRVPDTDTDTDGDLDTETDSAAAGTSEITASITTRSGTLGESIAATTGRGGRRSTDRREGPRRDPPPPPGPPPAQPPLPPGPPPEWAKAGAAGGAGGIHASADAKPSPEKDAETNTGAALPSASAETAAGSSAAAPVSSETADEVSREPRAQKQTRPDAPTRVLTRPGAPPSPSNPGEFSSARLPQHLRDLRDAPAAGEKKLWTPNETAPVRARTVEADRRVSADPRREMVRRRRFVAGEETRAEPAAGAAEATDRRAPRRSPSRREGEAAG